MQFRTILVVFIRQHKLPYIHRQLSTINIKGIIIYHVVIPLVINTIIITIVLIMVQV